MEIKKYLTDKINLERSHGAEASFMMHQTLGINPVRPRSDTPKSSPHDSFVEVVNGMFLQFIKLSIPVY